MTYHISKSNYERLKSLSELESIYVHPNKIPVRKLLSVNNIHYWLLEGLTHSSLFFVSNEFQQTHNDSSLYFFTLPCFYNEKYLQTSINWIQKVSILPIDKKQIIILCNSDLDLSRALRFGCSKSILCNQNTWINFDYFKIYNNTKKIYDMVMNCRPEKIKRPNLASKVKNLAIIKGTNHNRQDYFDLSQLNPMYMNKDRLSIGDVVKVMNHSYVGGIFSLAEGACYSSSEYLLCGLPVVSSKSFGGRDYWYDEYNSIIVDSDDPIDVLNATEELKSKLIIGTINPYEIRETHISLQLKSRKDFINLVDAELANSLITYIDINKWFHLTYHHKMVAYADFQVV